MSKTEKKPLTEDYYFYDAGQEAKVTATAKNNTSLTSTSKTVDKRQDYNFYEGDIEDIHTGELYNYNDAPARFGLIAGALALLAALVIVGLTGVIFHRDVSRICNSVVLSHLVMACLAVAAAALGAFVCLQARQAMARRADVNHLLVGLALILALAFFCYFLASAVFIFMYRPFHYSNLISLKEKQEAWNEKFGDNWSFEDGWGEDRRILWWLALFSLAAAAGFLLLAISLWLLAKFPVELARIVLGAACLAGVLLALFGIEYLVDARNVLGGNYVLRNTNFDFLSTLLVLLALGGVLLFANAVWNLFKRRSGHFLFGTVFIIYVFVFVCFLGLILRDLRRNQFNNISESSTYCRDLLDSFHAEDIRDFCPSKYLPAGAACGKGFLVSAWESDRGYRFVNPSCCHAANSFALCPLYVAGILGLLFVAAVLVAIAANYYLSDRSEYLEFADRKFGLFELLFVVGAVLAVVAFAFWWGFRPAASAPRQNAGHPQAIRDAFGSVSEYRDPNFTPVQLEKIYGGSVPPGVFIQGAVRNEEGALARPATRLHTGNAALTFALNPANCASPATCGFRAGILAVNGRFDKYTGTSVLGPAAARGLFFADSQLQNDFLFVFGRPDDLNAFVKVLKFVPIDISKESRLVFSAEQVDLAALGANGLKAGEALAEPALSVTGASFGDFGGYRVEGFPAGSACYANNSCQSALHCFAAADFSVSRDCRAAFVFHASSGTLEVRIPIKVLDAQGRRVAYDENSLASGSYYTHESTKYLIPAMGFAGGEARFSVPRPVHGNLFVSLDLLDKADHYLPYARTFVVPGATAGAFEAGEVLLLTKDGKGCAGAADPGACFAGKTVKFANIEVQVRDADSGEPLADMPVRLFSGADGARLLYSKISDSSGKAVFENAAYDYYTAQFPGSLGYFPARQSLKLQSETDGRGTLFARSRTSSSIILEQFVHSSPTLDQDFILSIVSDRGAKCKVAPYNKYCGYAEHLVDVRVEEEGFEKIRLDKFAVAHYLAYWEESPAYTGTCGLSDLANFKYYPQEAPGIRSLAFGWDRVRRLQAGYNYKSLYCFTGWGLNSIQYRNAAGTVEPSAADCASLYPEGSEFSVAKLRALFP